MHGQQNIRIHDRYMMVMMMIICSLKVRNKRSYIYRSNCGLWREKFAVETLWQRAYYINNFLVGSVYLRGLWITLFPFT